MSSVQPRFGVVACLLAATVLATTAARAQGVAKESIPGGVEARPSFPEAVVAPVPKTAIPAPAPPVAPMIRSAPGAPVTAPIPAPTAPAKKTKGPTGQKKSEVPPPTQAPAQAKAALQVPPLPQAKALPLATTRSLAPGATPGAAVPAASAAAPAAPSTPPVGGKDGRPGAVERVPGQPAAPQ